MTVQNLIDNLHSMNDTEREIQLRFFIGNIASSLTLNNLRAFQDNWHSGKNWNDFKSGMNNIIVASLYLEVTWLGNQVRMMENLQPLSLDTELNTAVLPLDRALALAKYFNNK